MTWMVFWAKHMANVGGFVRLRQGGYNSLQLDFSRQYHYTMRQPARITAAGAP